MNSTIYSLEMNSWGGFSPSGIPAGFAFTQVHDPVINERLYREIGEKWQWTDRLGWREEQWTRWAMRAEVETWIVSFEGEEAGYFELEKQEKGNVEIVYFGLRAAMIGRGIGSAMLTVAIKRAWADSGTRRVWVHTCSEDHPHAVANYEKRGFRVFKTEVVPRMSCS